MTKIFCEVSLTELRFYVLLNIKQLI